MKFCVVLLCIVLLAHLVPFSEEKSVGVSDGKTHHHHHHSRAKRVLDDNKQVLCGKKMLAAVYAACGTECAPGSNVDIYTHCCKKQCDYEEIKNACCSDQTA